MKIRTQAEIAEVEKQAQLRKALQLPWDTAAMTEAGNCVRLLDKDGEAIGHVQVVIYTDDMETWTKLQTAVNNIIVGNTKLVAKLLEQK